MSSELRDLVFRDLEQIPLPPAAAWTQRRSRRSRRGIGILASATIVVLVIVASLSGGQLLRAARDEIERLRAASTGRLVPGNDLVYVADRRSGLARRARRGDARRPDPGLLRRRDLRRHAL